jgi:hypothetical protein
MVKRLVVGIVALIFTPLFTYGMVDAAEHYTAWKLMPFTTYQGFFSTLFGWIWNTWCDFNGFAPFSHPNDFLPFFTRATLLGLPLIGFILFWFASGDKVGRQIWKPLLIAVVFSTPLETPVRAAFEALGMERPAAEALRSIVVLVLMIWSIRRIPIVPPKTTDDSAPLSGPHLSTN